jgi:pantothenate kinase
LLSLVLQGAANLLPPRKLSICSTKAGKNHGLPNRTEAYARRGADWTFDAAKLLDFVRVLRQFDTDTTDIIYAPSFDHAMKDPTPDAIEIGPSTSLVILEGSWLLLDLHPWKEVSCLVDDTWFIDVDPKIARWRIAQRHVHAGIEPNLSSALGRVDTNDMMNGRRIRSLLIPPRFKIRSIESWPRLPPAMPLIPATEQHEQMHQDAATKV